MVKVKWHDIPQNTTETTQHKLIQKKYFRVLQIPNEFPFQQKHFPRFLINIYKKAHTHNSNDHELIVIVNYRKTNVSYHNTHVRCINYCACYRDVKPSENLNFVIRFNTSDC